MRRLISRIEIWNLLAVILDSDSLSVSGVSGNQARTKNNQRVRVIGGKTCRDSVILYSVSVKGFMFITQIALVEEGVAGGSPDP